jgi:hypothetical protein
MQFDDRLANAEPERRELMLFQHLSGLQKQLQDASSPLEKETTDRILETVLRYAALPSPRQSAPIRHLMARILINIFNQRTETRSLFDTMASLCAILNDKKVEADSSIRSSVIHIIGALEECHGGKIISLLGECVSLIARIYRYAKDAELSLRVEALNSLVMILKGAGKGAQEDVIKDLLKLAKYGIQDKIILIRASSLRVNRFFILTLKLLEVIYSATEHPPPTKIDEYESLISVIIKSLEYGSDPNLRECVADAVSCILSISQLKPRVNLTASSIELSQNGITEPVLNFDEIFRILKTQLIKSSTREVRVGILHCYISFFKVSICLLILCRDKS